MLFIFTTSQTNSVLSRQHTVNLCWKMYLRRLFLLYFLSYAVSPQIQMFTGRTLSKILALNVLRGLKDIREEQ